jgi:hypothetical protein
MLERQFGITGMPGGGTHFAAKLFGIGHENGSGERGLADYLLHVPASRWLDQGNFVVLGRGGDGSQGAFTDRFAFENKLCVIRDPYRVVATNLGIENRSRKFIDRLAKMTGREFETDNLVDYAAAVTIVWYQQALSWANYQWFRCERPEEAAPYIDFPMVIPHKQAHYSLAAHGPRLSTPLLQAHMTPNIRKAVDSFRREFGYEG